MTRAKEGRRRRGVNRDEVLEALIPVYLRPYVYPYHGDFCYTPCFNPRFIAQLMAEGFLPIATEGMLLPKIHQHRCVVTLPNDFHVSKSVRKKAKKFDVTINESFDEVIRGCHEQHGSHCWLYPPLEEAFRTMYKMTVNGGGVDVPAMDTYTSGEATGGYWTVRLVTTEVWNTETGTLAAGELGYTVGSIYTSLTGFSREDSAGSVQLAALGRQLITQGFSMWDLGMEMDYKYSLGAHAMPRKQFLQHVHRVRSTHSRMRVALQVPTTAEKEAEDATDVLEAPEAIETVASDSVASPGPPPNAVKKNAKAIIDGDDSDFPIPENKAVEPSAAKSGGKLDSTSTIETASASSSQNEIKPKSKKQLKKEAKLKAKKEAKQANKSQQQQHHPPPSQDIESKRKIKKVGQSDIGQANVVATCADVVAT